MMKMMMDAKMKNHDIVDIFGSNHRVKMTIVYTKMMVDGDDIVASVELVEIEVYILSQDDHREDLIAFREKKIKKR